MPSNLVTEILTKLQDRSKIAIAGPPGSGKTELARALSEALGWHVLSTDAMIGREDWSAASVKVADAIQGSSRLIVEGTTVPRALRKLVFRPNFNPGELLVVWLPTTFDTPEQRAHVGRTTMAKSINTVWLQVRGYLEEHKVPIVER